MAVKPKGKIHRIFEELVFDLQQFNAIAGQAWQGNGAPQWQIPNKKEWSGDPLQIDSIDKAFDRREINENVEEVLSDATVIGTAGDICALKIQGDWLATMERSFRFRHATPVRCIGHMAARAIGKGKSSGVYSSGVLGYAQNILRIGSK